MTLSETLIQNYPDALRRFLNVESSLLIALLDSERCVISHNEAFGNAFGADDGDATGQRLDELVRTNHPDLPHDDEAWRIQFRPAEGDTGPLQGVVITENGGHVLFLRPAGRGGDDVVKELASLNQQLTDLNRELQKERRLLREANERIERMARTDTLTGLANRRVLDEEMERAISAARRHDQDLSVLMADLDKFKQVNDDYGHDVGDRVLKAFGKLLEDSCRTEDVPIRFGGEEFLVIMPQTNTREARRVAQRLRRQWQATDISQVDRSVTVSVGVSSWSEGDDHDDLIRRADNALYAAKDAGRNCVRTASQ